MKPPLSLKLLLHSSHNGPASPKPNAFLPLARPLRLTRAIPLEEKCKQAGYSLGDMMITMIVILILGSLVIANSLNSLRANTNALKARNHADAQAKITRLINAAKMCAIFNTEAGESPIPVETPTGAVISCGGKAPVATSLTSEPWKRITTFNCLGTTIENARKVTIEITANGQMSCHS